MPSSRIGKKKRPLRPVSHPRQIEGSRKENWLRPRDQTPYLGGRTGKKKRNKRRKRGALSVRVQGGKGSEKAYTTWLTRGREGKREEGGSLCFKEKGKNLRSQGFWPQHDVKRLKREEREKKKRNLLHDGGGGKGDRSKKMISEFLSRGGGG